MVERLKNFSFPRKLFPALGLALFYIFCTVVLRPFENLPFIDDWTYAWSVEHLLKTGELRILEWSAHYPLVQIFWGTLFTLPFGFSFSALRVSTVFLAWLGALAFYGTLRKLGQPPLASIIGTLLMLGHPTFFILTFSFMTDVPFISFANLGFFFFLQTGTVYAWLASLLALCAFFVRQLALAVPVAYLAYGLMIRRSERRPHLIAACLSVLIAVTSLAWINIAFGLTEVYAAKLSLLPLWLKVSPAIYLAAGLRLLLHFGLVLSPLTVPLLYGIFPKANFWIVSFFLSILLVCVYFLAGTLPRPLEDNAMWSLLDLGHTRYLMAYAPEYFNGGQGAFVSAGLEALVLVVAVLSSSVVLLRLIELFRRRSTEEGMFSFYVLFQTALIFGLWLFYDRYYVVLLPPLIILLLQEQRQWRTAAVGIILFLLISFTGTWDHLQVNRAAAAAVNRLVASGIPLSDIDAGYALNGWNLYAHAENLPPGQKRQSDVPFVTSKEPKPYTVALSPMAGDRVLQEIDVAPIFWTVIKKIYVLKKARSES